MTYDNIKQDVLALGFTDDLEDEKQFLLALNRAQSLLASEFPKKKTLVLARSNAQPKMTYDNAFGNQISLHKGEKIAFLYRLFDGAILFGDTPLPLQSGAGSFRYVAESDGAFSLEGDAEMYAISLYDADIPLALCEVNLPYVEYEIAKYDSGARAICALPSTVEGYAIEGASVEGLTFRLPRGYQGVFLVNYERSPAEIRQNTKEIEIEERLFPLFSLLVCAYLWLEDEPERAQYYMALYREGRERLRMAKTTHSEKINTDMLGWT